MIKPFDRALRAAIKEELPEAVVCALCFDRLTHIGGGVFQHHAGECSMSGRRWVRK